MKRYIDAAVEQFRSLLTEQLARVEVLEKGAGAKDFAKLEKITIGVCGGDGIGPVIVDAARSVLEALLADEIKEGRVELVPIEGLTIENRM